jgi:lysophospholipase L1-like esterase
MMTNPSAFFCASAFALGVVLLPAASFAQTPACSSPPDLKRLDQPLRHVAQRIVARQPITIVAVGSSSTAGAGATSSAASYPSRLEVELKQRFPHLPIKVLNRGVNGEEMADMLARFDQAVLAEKPDLVLWQVGTNAVLRHLSVTGSQTLLHDGLERLKASGADVVMIDPQFAPKVTAEANADRMVDMIRTAAKAENIAVFHRFDVMRHWSEEDHLSFESFLSPDRLHMNDWSYSCVAKLLAAAIDDAATRATAVAGSPTILQHAGASTH